jgi:hypothetical protein
MKITKKTILPGKEQVYTPIRGDTEIPYEIIGTEDIPIPDSDFVAIIGPDDTLLPDTPLEQGPTGPPGPQGPEGPQGIPGGGTAETWDSELPTTATDFAGIPAGTVIELGTSSINILKFMLYPVSISFTSFDMFFNPNVARYYHIGDEISEDTYQSKWTLDGVDDAVEDSLRITQGSTVLFTGSPSDTDVTSSRGPYTFNTETTLTFTVSVTGAYNDTISRNDSYFWRCPLYAGRSANETISSDDVESLPVTTNPQGGQNPFIFYSLATMRSGLTLEFPSTAEQTFIFWAIPKSINGTTINDYPQYDIQNSFIDVSNPNSTTPIAIDQTISELTVTKFGVTVVFDVYKTFNRFVGGRTIKVQEV